jgi:hypothetical protein
VRVLCLRQFNTLSDMQRNFERLRAIVELPGVSGFSARFPGSMLNPAHRDWEPAAVAFETARMIAGDKELQLRAMSGIWTPEHGLGHHMVYDGRGSEGTVDEGFGIGCKVPLAFNARGALNNRWLRWSRRLRARLIRASHKLDASVVHAFWPGLTWAEIACTVQMEEQPGWSFEAVREMHTRLMREWLVEAEGLDVEFPVSGHVARDYSALFGDVIAEAKTDLRYVLSRNDFREDINVFTMTFPPRRALQMIDVDTRQANGTEHDWNRLVDLALQTASGHGADYVEFYDPQFTSPAFRQVLAERFG